MPSPFFGIGTIDEHGRLTCRSAGACPPRSLACPRARRGTGPRPTNRTHGRRIYCSAGACPPRSLACPRARRGTGPRPTNRTHGRRIYRSAGACPPRSLACPRPGPRPTFGKHAPVKNTVLHRDQEVSPTGPFSAAAVRQGERTTVVREHLLPNGQAQKRITPTNRGESSGLSPERRSRTYELSVLAVESTHALSLSHQIR